MTASTTLFAELAAAARPFVMRAERTPHAALPDLVFSLPADGQDVARLRFFEPEGAPPYLRTVIPHDISPEEQLAVERHLEAHVTPVIRRRFSYPAWLGLADSPTPPEAN